jgi:hypothetical protein
VRDQVFAKVANALMSNPFVLPLTNFPGSTSSGKL